jgi:outer membrane lipoprotein-sorting protein
MGRSAVNVFRRLPLSRLLILCGLVVAIGVSATALASALSSPAKPAAKPLANAVHDALQGTPVEGVKANITLTNHLLEGASLASAGGQGGGITGSPLINGGSGRLWISKDGKVRLELQTEKGDTQIVYDGHTVSLYDAASNTIYRYTPSKGEGWTSYAPLAKSSAKAKHASVTADEVPSVAKIEEAITHLQQHATLSGATPTNVGGQPAYTVRISPKEGGSLLGGAEVSFDPVHGIPLRTAIYSSTSSAPVIELAATEVSYGPVSDSVFALSPPPGAKIEEIAPATGTASAHAKAKGAETAGAKPTVTTHGKGLSSIAVLESKTKPGSKSSSSALEGLPKVSINGTSASELRTALGTIITFERSGVRYVLAGSVPAASIEALARGL